MVKVTSVIIFLLSFSLSSIGAEIFLFDQYGKQVRNYEQVVSKIVAGDIIHLDKGKRFLIRAYLGGGGTTQVFGILWRGIDGVAKEAAIRLPKAVGVAGNSSTLYNSFLNFYSDTHTILNELKVPIPKLYEVSKSRYVIVERFHVTGGETLETFLGSLDNSKLNKIEFDKRISAFKDFVKKTSHISHVSDFKLEQVLFDNSSGKWILADWTYAEVNSSLVTKTSLFNDELMNFFEKKIMIEARIKLKELFEEIKLINQSYLSKHSPQFLKMKKRLLKTIAESPKQNMEFILKTLQNKPFSEIQDERILKFYRENIDEIIENNLMSKSHKINILRMRLGRENLESIRDSFLKVSNSSKEYLHLMEANLWDQYPKSNAPFLALTPTAEEVMRYADILVDKSAQLELFNSYLGKVKTASEYLKVVNYPEFGVNTYDRYHVEELFNNNLENFNRLDPSKSEIKYFESLLDFHKLSDARIDFTVILQKHVNLKLTRCTSLVDSIFGH